MLAESFGIAITAARLRIYAEDLCDLEQTDLSRSIRRVIRECKFFPTIGELRQLAGASGELRVQLESEVAWQAVERDLSGNGKDAQPHLDTRTEYAIRCAGGRLGINACFSASVTTEEFTKKRFVEAFRNYDVAQHLGLAQLPAAVSNAVREITGGARKALPAIVRREADVEARRALLAQQAEQLAAAEQRRSDA